MKTKQQIRSITPERAQEMLKEMGVNISTTKAALVLDFMYKSAILEVEKSNRK
jgi:hypothetical protein